jgi:hypothetical protein
VATADKQEQSREGLTTSTRSIKRQNLYHEADVMCICISDKMTAAIIVKQKIKKYLSDYGK